MPMILAEYPKTKLVILGKGEQQNDIIDTANRLGISQNVACMFDFVPENERILHYAASDLCVFPSTYEPFGIVSLEAMSMAKPIAVGAQGVVGFREQVVPIGPDQNGVHVNGGNPTDIAWGLKEILADPDRAKKWGENGRRRVLQYFTWRKAAEQTLQIYDRLLHPSVEAECHVVDLIDKITRN
jgi:glycogen(starch) synthase